MTLERNTLCRSIDIIIQLVASAIFKVRLKREHLAHRAANEVFFIYIFFFKNVRMRIQLFDLSHATIFGGG